MQKSPLQELYANSSVNRYVDSELARLERLHQNPVSDFKIILPIIFTVAAGLFLFATIAGSKDIFVFLLDISRRIF